LQIDPAESEAIQCRLIALIKTKNFQEAKDLVKGKESRFPFEYSYLLHRMADNEAAFKALKKAESVGEKHLMAQVVSIGSLIPPLAIQAERLRLDHQTLSGFVLRLREGRDS